MRKTAISRNMAWILTTMLLAGAILFPVIGYAGETERSEAQTKELQIQKQIAYVHALHEQIAAAQLAHSQAASQYEIAKKDQLSAQAGFERVRDSYERASKNPDIILPETLMKQASEYQAAKKVLDLANQNLQTAERERSSRQETLNRLEEERRQAQTNVQSLKADLFDFKLQEPVWTEGYGEVVLTEDKTPLQCRELALAIAKQEAIERGGKSLIESISEVKNFQLVRDEIKITGNAQIIEQDTNGEFGKVKRVIEGDAIKYVVKVRVKLVGSNVPNPFRPNNPGTAKTGIEPVNRVNGLSKDTADKAERSLVNAVVDSVAGTTWIGTSNGKPYEFYFQPDGSLHYKSPTGFWKNATWKQNGNQIYWETNNKYAEYQGVIDGSHMEGTAGNVTGLKWNWTVEKK